MTMSGERAWALCGAESFLTEVRRYHDLPENLRYQIPDTDYPAPLLSLLWPQQLRHGASGQS